MRRKPQLAHNNRLCRRFPSIPIVNACRESGSKTRNKLFSTRSQSAIEYILLTGLVLLFIIPLSVISINMLAKYRQTSSEAQVNRLGNDLVATAELVQSYGAPSQLILPAVMPAIKQISVITNTASCTRCTELRFNLSSSQVYFQTTVPIRQAGKTPDDCKAPLECVLPSSFSTPGNKRFVLKAETYTPASGSQVNYVTIALS